MSLKQMIKEYLQQGNGQWGDGQHMEYEVLKTVDRV